MNDGVAAYSLEINQSLLMSNSYRERRGFRAQMDVGQQQRGFYAPSTGRDLGHGVVIAGIFVSHGELYCLLTHSIVFFNSLGSTLFPSARIFRTCSIKWNGVSVIWIYVMLCRKGRLSTLGKKFGELVSLPPSTNAF